MLCQNYARNEAYKEFLNKLNLNKNREHLYREITEFCEKCQPLSPITCVELCQIWNLKKEFRDSDFVQKTPMFLDLIKIARNSNNLKILKTLMSGPVTIHDLLNVLKKSRYSQSFKDLNNSHIKQLSEYALIEKQDNELTITRKGMKIYNLLTKSEIKLPADFNVEDEDVLNALSFGTKSYSELVNQIPKGRINLSLKRLQENNLIVKIGTSGNLLYFKTKRRPTRKLSPIELKIFSSLTKDGTTIKDLSKNLGLDFNQLSQNLRLLGYKRHVKTEEQPILYDLTNEGKSLMMSLNIAKKLIL